MSEAGRIYIGSILLEKGRWSADKTPTYRVSEWTERFAEAGFDGIELWEYHATLCSPEELGALEKSACPVAIFNSYASLDDDGEKDRQTVVEMTKRLGASGVKFNVGKDPGAREHYVRNLRQWRDALGPGVQLLCECHGGTIVEEPAEARRFFDEVGGEWQIMVHAFSRPERLRGWVEHFGSDVVHVHAHLTSERRYILFEHASDRITEAIRVLREGGFCDSFTLEFTEGTRTPDETIEGLWENAVRDLEFLRGVLS